MLLTPSLIPGNLMHTAIFTFARSDSSGRFGVGGRGRSGCAFPALGCSGKFCFQGFQEALGLGTARFHPSHFHRM